MLGPIGELSATSAPALGVYIGRLLAAMTVLTSLSACMLRKPYPPEAVVRKVELQTARHLPTGPLLKGLATTPSRRFLALWDGVAFEYEVYDPDVLAKDLQRVESYLIGRGYYEARVVASRVIAVDEHRVRIEIRVLEGAPVLVRSIDVVGLDGIAPQTAADIRREMVSSYPLRVGEPFDETLYAQSKERVRETLREDGYAFAEVTGRAEVDVTGHRASVTYRATPNQRLTLGDVSIVGLEQFPEAKVRRIAHLERGQRFSPRRLDAARRALLALGVFSSVEVNPAKRAQSGNRLPVTIVVTEAPPRAVHVAAGVQLDSLEMSNQVQVGWEHKNLFGGLRRFDVHATPGLVYYPTRFGNLRTPTRGLLQVEGGARLQQPAFPERLATAFVALRGRVAPLLYPNSQVDDPIIGFSEVGASTGVHRAIWKHQLRLTSSFSWSLHHPVDYSSLTIGRGVAANDDLLTSLKIAFPEVEAVLDLRDDALRPTSGVLLELDTQAGSPILGSDLADLRLRPEARLFYPVSRRVVIATRLLAGWLFPSNYGETLDGGNFSASDLARDQQALLFRGFFSGGPNSNRGYPLRSVGPTGQVLYLSRNVDCAADPLARECNRPLGGTALWEGSIESRFGLTEDFGLVSFVDVSDVARKAALSFASPHPSVGLGMRYATPVGPIRLDYAVRLPVGRDYQEGQLQHLFRPGTVPASIYLTLGEAF